MGTAIFQWRSRVLRTRPGLVEDLTRGLLLRCVHEESLNGRIVDDADFPASENLLELQASHAVLATHDAAEDDLGHVPDLDRGINDDAGAIGNSGVGSRELFSGAVLWHVIFSSEG